MPKTGEHTFEENLAELERIVERMEAGDTSLQELMKNYSKGIELAKSCQAALERAEKTVDILVGQNDNGEVTETELKLGM